MQRFSGLLLTLAGTAIGAYAYLTRPAEDGATSLAEVTRISVAPDRQPQRSIEPVRSFSPASPAFRQSGEIEPAAPVSAVPIAKPGAWTTVVTAEPGGSETLKSSRPRDLVGRAELARDLQRELKRVGCYGGEINGVWTPASKAAMAAFMDRVNATLPYNEPDYILLTLVQGHSDIACGVECPKGQLRTESGRCVPRAVVAQASKKAKQLDESRMAEARLASDQARDRNAGVKAKGLSEQTEVVASAGPEKLPWIDGSGRSITASPPQPRGEALPGRMSIGGPEIAPASGANVSSQWQTVPIDARDPSRQAESDRSNVGGAPASVATLSPAQGSPYTSDQSAQFVTGNSSPITLGPDGMPLKPHKSASKSSAGEKEGRRYRDAYAPAGRTRHGDPRPGSMRYNLVQALGGIY